MLHLVSGFKSLYMFVNFILVPVPPFSTHLFLHPSLLLLIHHSTHPLLPLSFTPRLKSTNFTNPIPYFHFFLPDCLHGLLPGPFLLSYSVFVFSFSLFFVSVSCARLSWTSLQLLSARKSAVIVSCCITVLFSFSPNTLMLCGRTFSSPCTALHIGIVREL